MPSGSAQSSDDLTDDGVPETSIGVDVDGAGVDNKYSWEQGKATSSSARYLAARIWCDLPIDALTRHGQRHRNVHGQSTSYACVATIVAQPRHRNYWGRPMRNRTSANPAVKQICLRLRTVLRYSSAPSAQGADLRPIMA